MDEAAAAAPPATSVSVPAAGPILELADVRKRYRADEPEVIRLARLTLERGSQTLLIGESGIGKTTLLYLISGILRPDAGLIVVDGTDLATLSDAALDRFRARKIGLVFQSFQLLPGFSALENVLLALTFGGAAPGAARRRAQELLAELGLAELAHRRPGELSTGQQQRVALARALANSPPLVLADEPTANLDPRNKTVALELLQGACRAHAATLLVVAHDPAVAEQFPRVVRLEEVNR